MTGVLHAPALHGEPMRDDTPSKRNSAELARASEYRICTVGLEGRLISYEVLQSTNDADAITEANRHLRNHDVELWFGNRLVTKLRRR